MLRDQPAGADGLPTLPVAAADAGWQVRGIDPATSPLDTLLASFTVLGSDRPDNPLLLVQSGALWLEETTLDVDGEQVSAQVFAAPPSDAVLGPDDEQPTPESATVRFTLDERSLMLRAELLIGLQWVTIDFSDAPSDSPAHNADLADVAAVLAEVLRQVGA